MMAHALNQTNNYTNHNVKTQNLASQPKKLENHNNHNKDAKFCVY